MNAAAELRILKGLFASLLVITAAQFFASDTIHEKTAAKQAVSSLSKPGHVSSSCRHNS